MAVFSGVYRYLLFGFVAAIQFAAAQDVVTAPVITTVAGNGTPAVSSDKGIAKETGIGEAAGVAVDAQGNLYFSDAANHVIRKVSPDGLITRFAGIEALGFSGDNGPATQARLNGPQGIAVDGQGNLYVADTGNRRVRKIAADGRITTIAGTGLNTSEGDGGAAVLSTLREPVDVLAGDQGRLFIADTAASRIRVITADGVIDTFAGGDGVRALGDNGPAKTAGLSGPRGMAMDSAGNLCFADQLNERIRCIDSQGVIRTLAGNGVAAWSSDNQPASQGSVNDPHGVAFDNQGNLYIADTLNHQIRVVSRGGSISTFAGRSPGFQGDDGLAQVALLNRPTAITRDAAGNLYFADAGNRRIRKITFPELRRGAPQISSIRNAASGDATLAGGTFVTIRGASLALETATWDNAISPERVLPTQLGGVRVTINNRPAYLSYVSPAQINLVTPADATVGVVSFRVTTADGSADASAFYGPASPGLFSFNVTGRISPVALLANQNTYIADSGAIPGAISRPATAGDVLTLYATGLGETNPVAPDGKAFSGAYAVPDLSLFKLTMGSKTAILQFIGLVAPGLYQINAQVPADIESGLQPTVLRTGAQSTQTGLTLPFTR